MLGRMETNRQTCFMSRYTWLEHFIPQSPPSSDALPPSSHAFSNKATPTRSVTHFGPLGPFSLKPPQPWWEIGDFFFYTTTKGLWFFYFFASCVIHCLIVSLTLGHRGLWTGTDLKDTFLMTSFRHTRRYHAVPKKRLGNQWCRLIPCPLHKISGLQCSKQS